MRITTTHGGNTVDSVQEYTYIILQPVSMYITFFKASFNLFFFKQTLVEGKILLPQWHTVAVATMVLQPGLI